MFYYLHYFVAIAIGWRWRLILTINSYTQSQVHSFVHYWDIQWCLPNTYGTFCEHVGNP